MKLSYLLKLSALSLVLGFLPLHAALAGCGCESKASTDNVQTNSNDVQSNSNAETQQEPLPQDDEIL